MEIWKDIRDYEGLYQVSNLGRVKSLDITDRLGRSKKGKIKIAIDNGNGYLLVNLKHDGKQKMKTVHRLVAEAFISNSNNYPCINHKDGNKQNNVIDNLEWCTYSQNNKHAFDNNLNHQRKGTDNPRSKLTKEQVDYIRSNYKKYNLKYGAEALAKKFNVSATTIKFVVWGKRYA